MPEKLIDTHIFGDFHKKRLKRRGSKLYLFRCGIEQIGELTQTKKTPSREELEKYRLMYAGQSLRFITLDLCAGATGSEDDQTGQTTSEDD